MVEMLGNRSLYRTFGFTNNTQTNMPLMEFLETFGEKYFPLENGRIERIHPHSFRRVDSNGFTTAMLITGVHSYGTIAYSRDLYVIELDLAEELVTQAENVGFWPRLVKDETAKRLDIDCRFDLDKVDAVGEFLQGIESKFLEFNRETVSNQDRLRVARQLQSSA